MTKRTSPVSEGLREALDELADQRQIEAAVRAEIARLEVVLELAEELGVAPATLELYIVAGEVEAAVLADPRLSPQAKTTLRTTYRALLSAEGLEFA